MCRLHSTSSTNGLVLLAILLFVASCDDGTEPPTPGQIVVYPASVTFTALADTMQLSAKVLTKRGAKISGVPVNWSSSDAQVVSVSSSGIAAAVSAGTATVTASAAGVSGSAQFAVQQQPNRISLSPAADTLYVIGGTLQFTANVTDRNGHSVPSPEVVWASSNLAVLSVSQTGLATANATGSAVISVSIGSLTADGEVFVPGVDSIVVSPSLASLQVGDTTTLVATLLSSLGRELFGRKVSWSSSDEGVAVVDSLGQLTAFSRGEALITASAEDRSGGSTLIAFSPLSDSVTVEEAQAVVLEIGHGSRIELPPGAFPAGTKVSAEETTLVRGSGDVVSDRPVLRIAITPPTASSSIPAMSPAALPTPDLTWKVMVSRTFDSPPQLPFALLHIGEGDAARAFSSDPDRIETRRTALGQIEMTLELSFPVDPYTRLDVELEVTGCWNTASEGSLAHLYQSGTNGADTGGSDRDKIPLVLVHGWQSDKHCHKDFVDFWPDDPEGDETWSRWYEEFNKSRILDNERELWKKLRDRYELWTFRYESYQPIELSAQQLGQKIGEVLPDRDVIIFAHSMGGLVSSRFMLAEPNGSRVRQLISLGTPYGGSVLADDSWGDYSTYAPCTDLMRTANPLLKGLLLDGRGASHLSPSATVPRMVIQRASELQGKITAYAGDVGHGLWSLLDIQFGKAFKDYLTSQTGACLLREQGFPESDGIVPRESAILSFQHGVAPETSHRFLTRSEDLLRSVMHDLVALADHVGAAPKRIELAHGNGQEGRVGERLQEPLIVRVTDAAGVVVRGAAVTFTAESRSGLVTPTETVTDQWGLAQAWWTLPNEIGDWTAFAAAVDLTGIPLMGSPIVFSATSTQMPLLEITTSSLPDATISQAYSASLEATGGDGTYTWSIVEGVLPTGLSLSSGGQISGVPGGSAHGSWEFASAVASAGQTATKQFSLTVVDDTSINLGIGFGPEQFALIPAGSFQMGDDNGYENERPVHTVRIRNTFHMQRTEVTVSQWMSVMGTNPSGGYGCTDETCPVQRVSWEDIQGFLIKLNNLDPGKNYRLPTEAEWEYAARAGTAGDYGGTGVLDEMGWYSGNSGNSIHPVAKKLPNFWGLYDMHGNVFEWVQDWYKDDYYSVSPTEDPQGPAADVGWGRVVRGGSFWVDAMSARSAVRGNEDPSVRSSDSVNGFRLLKSR